MIEKVLDILTKLTDKVDKLEARLDKIQIHSKGDKFERRIYFAIILTVILLLVVGVKYEDGQISFVGSELLVLVKFVGSSSIAMLCVQTYLSRGKQ